MGFGSALLVGLATLLPSTARASEVRCTIPFSFMVDAQTLPPGTYTISQESTQGSVLLVRDLHHGAFAQSSPFMVDKGTHPKLVFHKFGDQYVLREVWMTATAGRALPETRRERDLMEASVRGGGAEPLVEVVLLVP